MKLIHKLFYPIAVLFITVLLVGCGGNGNETPDRTANRGPVGQPSEKVVDAVTDPENNKGIGPVENVKLTALNEEMAGQGQKIFEEKCSACHKIEQRYIGPPLKEVTARRSPEWIMNMIMNPEEMVQKDPVARALLAEYLSPMANQNISREEARSILEYFRSVDQVDNVN